MVEKSSVGKTGWATAALAGVVAGLLAAHTLGSVAGPDGHAAAARPSVTAGAQIIDRSHKGDRLAVAASPAVDQDARGRLSLRKLFERARSRQLHDACEPPASPYVDPQLAKLPGRCFT